MKTRRIRTLYTGNIVYGRLPQGCKLCLRGLKTVILVTGVCPRKCFYCPLDTTKRGKDVLYVNERPAISLNEIIAETAICGSRGAGITGGDPLLRLERTLTVINALKTAFGSSFHIHLYTTGRRLTKEAIELLEAAGLDELRIHPDPRDVNRLLNLFSNTRPSFTLGFEIPIMPDAIESTVKLVEKLDDSGCIDFINLNELEFTETNSAHLRARGYTLAEDGKTAVGSRDAALQVIEQAAERGVAISVHFCPASSKDSFQYRLRLYRRGVLAARFHELVSDEGTLLKAIIPETCESVPSIVTFRSARGLEAPLLLAELAGTSYSLVEELPDFARTLLNIV